MADNLVLDIYDYTDIDFDACVTAGVKGIIIKTNEGVSCVMDRYNEFIDACEQRGLSWGVYCFTHATTPCRAEQEAQTTLDCLAGRIPPMGVWFDIEAPESLGCGQATDVCSAFINYINSKNIPCGVYISEGHCNTQEVDPAALADYVPWWIAQYNGICDFATDFPNNLLAGWQYSEHGTTACNNGEVDENRWYLDF